MEIGIIGFGSFGRLMAKHLKSKAKVFVFDNVNKEKEANEMGVSFIPIEKVASKQIVILAVPMENIEEVLVKIKDSLQKNALVFDVCSLKIFSCELMKKILPESVEIIGTHPLFGPQSAPNSIEGMKIALCNVRVDNETFDLVKEFCKSLGLNVFVTTPEEHDRQMALSQALTHFIGQAMKNADIKRIELSTKTFDKLMDVAEIIGNDTPALFNNMQTMNPFAGEVRQRLMNELNKIDVELK
ncbi:prephenate dehydrogenase [Candidatus Pacearchaeota archaeon]|nr:prephenate dehydrogenase [Candidatus Pacearchaeota archaeon]